MKRSYLKRYTPLKSRAKVAMRNTRLRTKSLKRQREERALEPALDEYRQLFPCCQYPGCRNAGECIHEITRGSSRWTGRQQRACILHLCGFHHLWSKPCVQSMSLAAQCAIKQRADPEGYDLAEINRVRGRPQTALTQEEVDNQWATTKGRS